MENENQIKTPQPNVVKNKIIETYAQDMAKVVEGNEGELIKNMIHEQEMQELEKKNLSPKSNKNRVFMFVGFLLLFLAIGILFFLLFFKQKINTVEIQTPANSIIFTDQNNFQEVSGLSKDEITQSIFNETINTDVENGAVEAIYLTSNKQVIGLREFIKIIKANFIVPKLDIVDDNFLIGVANKNNKDLFILIKVKSFIDSFDSMHQWEDKMFNDLHGLFGVKISNDTKDLLTKDFVDGRVANKSSRILYDKDGHIVLMYIFADEHSVIITNSEEATNEVILRLAASQVSK